MTMYKDAHFAIGLLKRPHLMTSLALIVAAVAYSTPCVSAQTSGNGSKYAIIELTAPNQHIFAFAISDAGYVCGTDYSNNDGFNWREGHSLILRGINPDASAEGHAVNSYGVVVGTSRGTLYNSTEATVWNGADPPFGLGSLGGDFSEALGINDQNHVIGEAALLDDSNIHAFLWIGGQMQDLGSLSDVYGSVALGINNQDQVVGWSGIELGAARAVLWDHGQITNLGTLGGNDSQAWAINDLTQIVGYASDPQGRDLAFLWQDGVMQSIHNDALGDYSEALSINNSTQVVGMMSGNGFLSLDGFIWDADNGMHNLEDFLPPDSQWDLTIPYGINNHGQVAGYGTRYGLITGYLITPVTPTLHMDDPSSLQAGTDVTFTIHNADPGKTVHFIYGRVGGGYLIPGCNSQTGAVLQMDDPTVIGTATADANGDASITAFVPLAARNAGDILLQAVEQSQCKITQLVVVRFQ